MITGRQITDIVTLYTKHGWKLRRVLLSEPHDGLLEGGDLTDVNICEAALDALWFSRRSRPGSESWELRRLTGAPFALVEIFEDGITQEEFESRLAEVEDRMLETLNSADGD